MESRTYIKNVKITPKKLRFLAPEVASLGPVTALEYLEYTPKKGARIFYKAIKSAINNATQTLKAEPEKLVFKHLIIEEGTKLKRFRAGGRGTAKPYRKKFAHIKIVLTTKEEPTVKPEQKAEKKQAEREEVKTQNLKVKSETKKSKVIKKGK